MNEMLLFHPETAKRQAIPYLMKEFCRLFGNWIEYAKSTIEPEDMQPLMLQIHSHLIRQLHQELREQETVQERICRYVLQNLPKGPTVKGLANELGYSTKYCSKMIIAQLGEPFSDYVKRVRLAEAKHHLAENNCSIADVAGFIGFQDQFAFSHFFKKAVGVSPQAYRKQHVVSSQKLPSSPRLNLAGELANILQWSHDPKVTNSLTKESRAAHSADCVVHRPCREERDKA